MKAVSVLLATDGIWFYSIFNGPHGFYLFQIFIITILPSSTTVLDITD